MTADSATFKGRAEVLPWRVGLLTDIQNRESVLGAIQRLRRAWGGIYMPILDATSTVEEVRREVEHFDVDSIYTQETAEHLEGLLQEPGYQWSGRAEFGPLEYPGPFGKSVLAWDRLAVQSSLYTGSAPKDSLLWHASTLPSQNPKHPLDIVKTGAPHLRPRYPAWNGVGAGLVIVDPDDLDSVLSFWNLRASGLRMRALVPDALENFETMMNEVCATLADMNREQEASLGIWAKDAPNSDLIARIRRFAKERDIASTFFDIEHRGMRPGFQGLESDFRKDFSAEVSRSARLVEVPLPQVPLRERSGYHVGLVRAHITVSQARNFDPRLTAAVPPFRRHSRLLTAIYQPDVNDARPDDEGISLSVEANRGHVGYPLPSALEVMQALFDDDAVKVKQSDQGLFESRAAEMFGHPIGDHLTQPGLRSAILKAARSTSGVAFGALKDEIYKNRGQWPGPLSQYRDAPHEYAKQLALMLTDSMYLVPMLRVRCTYCGVWESHEVDRLATVNRCEFCGVETRLGLAIGAGRERWTYRAASRLPESQMRAMMTSVASLSVLQSLMRIEGPPECHVLGLEVTLPGRQRVEIDVATVLHNRDWVTVIGETKAESSTIDQNDIDNLHAVRAALVDAGVPTVMMFATTSSTFTQEEVSLLRNYMDGEGASSVFNGAQVYPACPLVLTRKDLSLPTSDDEHPWKWGDDYSMGVFRTALESARRNLGLETWKISSSGTKSIPAFTWSSPDQ